MVKQVYPDRLHLSTRKSPNLCNFKALKPSLKYFCYFPSIFSSSKLPIACLFHICCNDILLFALLLAFIYQKYIDVI